MVPLIRFCHFSLYISLLIFVSSLLVPSIHHTSRTWPRGPESIYRSDPKSFSFSHSFRIFLPPFYRNKTYFNNKPWVFTRNKRVISSAALRCPIRMRLLNKNLVATLLSAGYCCLLVLKRCLWWWLFFYSLTSDHPWDGETGKTMWL